MIDYDFEARLIERIALREVISAARLDVRQKRVLRCHLHGQTFAEIAENEGRSIGRVQQIYEQSVRKIRHKVRADTAGFDNAGFLRHMQGLVEQREKYERWDDLEAERADLERMLAEELKPEPPPPPPPSPPSPPVAPDWLIQRLVDAGEYYQAFQYIKARVMSDFGSIRSNGLPPSRIE